MACNTYVNQTVCVSAEVTVRPLASSTGASQAICTRNPIIGDPPGPLQEFCTFNVCQPMCVQIPLTFDATASAEANGIVCGEASPGECNGGAQCTFSRGQFQTNVELRDELIEAAGGTIVLGQLDDEDVPIGYSFVVNTGNANLVFTNSVPGSPSPQYNQLYAQLLTAKLNLQNGATCEYAEIAISDADQLLTETPFDNEAAEEIQTRLELFNTGEAPGCPFHCGTL